jgi:spermidine synthase
VSKRRTHAAAACAAHRSVRRGHTLLPFQTIAETRLKDGSEFTLLRRGEEWVLRVGPSTLMSSQTSTSEVTLAHETLRRVTAPRDVLVGGLGLGYTLRAVLDRVGPETNVAIAELVPELVEWNRVHLGHLANFPLNESRCTVLLGDVLDRIRAAPGAFDAILLDVDNGPAALSNPHNQQLYGDRGARYCGRALRPGGVLAVWSRGPCARYERTLNRAGFDVEVLSVGAFDAGSAKHVLFIATRTEVPLERRVS